MSMVTEIFTLPDLNSKHSNNSNPSLLESMIIIKPIIQDDKTQLISHSKQLFSHTITSAFNSTTTEERFIISRIFQQCCLCDSIDCSTALLNGEVEGGMSPLHADAKRVVELLLKKHACTDLKSKDGRGLLALEPALCSDRMDVMWHSIEDLVVCLCEKDLTPVKLLSEKTKEFDDVAYAVATKGRVVQLAALLAVAAKKVFESKFVVLRGETKTTIYECLIREALALRRGSTTITAHGPHDEDENAERRKLLLCEIELLQLFGAGFERRCTDKNVTSPLIVACQEGDEEVVELILQTNIDVNDVDAGGNSALHWSLKAAKISFEKQMRLISFLLKHGALVNQKKLMGLTAVHVAASNGIPQVVEVLLLNDPKSIYFKTETQETPLFFAVRNNHMDCAKLLLRWGAERKVLNLRKNRPIDFARTQDMRSVLNPVNISRLSNRSSPNQHEYDSALQSDEVVLETCKALLKTTQDGSTTERMSPKPKAKVCKCFDSTRGCVRGETCLYAHDEEELWQIKQETSPNLSPSVNSDSLVTGEKTVEMPSVKRKENPSSLKTSNEKSIIAETSSSKTADEIKFELKSWVDMLLRKPSPAATQPQPRNNNTSSAERNQPMWLKKFKRWLPGFLTKKSGHCYALSSLKVDFRSAFGLELDHSSLGYSKLSDFMRSFPGLCQMKFLPIGKYGYANHLVLFPCPPPPSKLLRRTVTNDNIENGNPNGSVSHEDQLPASSDICSLISSDSPEKMVTSQADKVSSDVLEENSPHDALPNAYFRLGTSVRKTSQADKVSSDVLEENSPHDALPNAYFRLGTSVRKTSQPDKVSSDVPEESSPHDAYSRFLKFLEPDSLFHSRPWLSNGRDGGIINEKIKFCNQRKHLVLEALVRKWNKSPVFSLREFDFYDNYKANTSQRKCFGCKQCLVQWANYPCQHMLWCTGCKLQFALAVGSFKPLCVICDVEVQRIELHPLNGRDLSLRGFVCNDAEFPLLIRRM